MPAELATRLDLRVETVEAALRQLDRDDVIALAPGTTLIWLAHPFSALDAPFRVVGGDGHWDAICIWDALGILVVVQADGEVRTPCPDCGEELVIRVHHGQLGVPDHYLVHYGVPAARWYEDVGYT